MFALYDVACRGGFKVESHTEPRDEFGLTAVEKPVHPHDLHATVLHLLGLDHTRVDLSLQRSRFPLD